VQKVRADGKLDLILDKPGYGKTLDLTGQILAKLQQQGGELQLSDKSSPEEIYAAFGVSKKVFKQAIGALFKEQKIELSPQSIKLKV
jgi:predicted RNA-binding protein (virulence factor B family)